MADHPEAAPRLQVIIDRDAEGRWRWKFGGKRCEAGPWVRIESAVANLEEVLGVQTEWVKFKPGQRRLIVIGRPVDVTIQR
jgi:hypothetical protein